MNAALDAGARCEPEQDVAALDVAGLDVSFAGVGQVLHGVDLRIEAGACVAVVGESGAGKSVLARAVLGLAAEGGSRAEVSADRLEVAGQDVRRFTPRAWRRLRGRQVGLVLQDALGSLDPLRTVGAEVGEALALRGVSPARRREPVRAALAAAGLDSPEIRAAQRPGELSGGMRQRALIASALVAGPPLLVADEPTTALDATVAVHVLDLLARLRDEGTAILLVSHDLAAVARVADHVVVLAGGQVVEAGPTDRVLSAPSQPYTRTLIGAIPHGPKPTPSSFGIEVRLRGRDLSRSYRLPGGDQVSAVKGVDLDLRAGEALGIVGESGSGKSTLARLLVAAEAPDTGQVLLEGEPWSAVAERARRPRRSAIQFIPQDPLGSFDPRHSVGRILATALTRSGLDASARTLLERVGLGAEVLRRYPRTLSGGQRQRVAIARALAAAPQVLVCDEPVSALDVTVQAGILDLLADLQHDEGLSLVFISHDLAVVRRVSDTVAVMRAGQIIETGQVEDVFADPAQEFTAELLRATLPR